MTERDPLDERPDPDGLLADRRGEENGAGTAAGAAGCGSTWAWRPGVGKTYRMLEEGHRRAERGTDVVVGFVETHGRPRTAGLLDGPRGRAPPPASSTAAWWSRRWMPTP